MVFDAKSVPPVGYRNIKISVLLNDLANLVICHAAGSEVIDAGFNTEIPGNYNWEPATHGLQYSNSDMAKFILEHPGTPS